MLRLNFNAIFRLLQKGSMTKTLFGVEYAKAHQGGKAAATGERKPVDINSPEFQALVKDALAEMKQNGQL